MDRITIRGIEVYANHGCLMHEKTLGQKFYVNLDMFIDLKAAARDDDLEKTINYAQVCDNVTEWMTKTSYNLIETAADVIARNILKTYQDVTKVIVEIEKPQAPVKQHFSQLFVHVERERHIVFLSLGSNMGRREENIQDAIEMLGGRLDTRVIAVSDAIETKPYGFVDQDDFINLCVKVETYLEAHQLLAVVNMIERTLGRVRDVRWGPRTIDVDIIFYDNEVIDTESLHIPHIDMHNRYFVLKPLSQIGGYMRHPLLGKTVDDMLKSLEKEKTEGKE